MTCAAPCKQCTHTPRHTPGGQPDDLRCALQVMHTHAQTHPPGEALQRNCRSPSLRTAHLRGPAGTITWRRAFFEALSLAFELTYVRKARRQRGWRRGPMAARSKLPSCQIVIALQSSPGEHFPLLPTLYPPPWVAHVT